MIVSTSQSGNPLVLKRSMSMSCGYLCERFTGAGSEPERGRFRSWGAARLICSGCVPLRVGVKHVGRCGGVMWGVEVGPAVPGPAAGLCCSVTCSSYEGGWTGSEVETDECALGGREFGPTPEPATAAAAAAAATDSTLSVSEKQVLLEYPDESTGGLLNVKMGWGLLAMGANRGELSEEREEDDPMPSLRVERLS